MSDNREARDNQAMARKQSRGTGLEKNTLDQEQSRRVLKLEELHLELRTKLLQEQLEDMQAARRDRRIVARLAIGIPLALLVFLALVLMFPGLSGGFFHNAATSMWPKIILISTPILTFIFVFGALVRGVFASSKGANGEQRPEQLAQSAARHWGG